MKNKIIFFYFFLASMSMLAQQKMNENEIKSFKAEVSKTAKEMTSLTADFIQKKHMKALVNPVESTGKLYVKMPDKVLLETQKPETSAILFKGSKMVIKGNGKSKEINLEKNKNFKQLNRLIVGTHNGNLLNDDHFTVQYFKEGTTKIVYLTPKSKEALKYMKQVELYFKGGEASVSEVKMIEPKGDYTVLTFKNKKQNVSIKEALFN